MMGESQGRASHCVLTLVERKSGYLMIGKLPQRTAAKPTALVETDGAHPGVRTITADNGTEFHWYGQVEAVHPVKFYFATPHHSWSAEPREHQRDSSGSTCPKEKTMAPITPSELRS